jgi:hypothetical protein
MNRGGNNQGPGEAKDHRVDKTGPQNRFEPPESDPGSARVERKERHDKARSAFRK